MKKGEEKETDISGMVMSAKVMMVAITIIGTLFTCYVVKSVLDSADSSVENIFVADQNSVLMFAKAHNMQANRGEEAKAELKRFHDYFFNLSPNAASIQKNMSRAFALGDKSVQTQYGILKEKGYYTQLIAGGIATEYRLDDIKVKDNQNGSFSAVISGTLAMVYDHKVEFHAIKTDCVMESTDRTMNNPNGFCITNFVIRSNQYIKEIDR